MKQSRIFQKIPHLTISQQTILWFQPIQISIKTLFSIDLLMMLINSYVFVYGSTHTFTIGLFNYIYGMLVLTSRNPYISSHHHMKKFPLLYSTNLLVWYCQLARIHIGQKQQLLMAVGVIYWYFWQHFLVFFLIMFESFFSQYPSFQQTFLTGQLISLKYYFSIFLNTIFDSHSFDIVRNLPYIARIIQNIKIAQFKNQLQLIRFVMGIISQNLQIGSLYWYMSKTISTALILWLDLFYFWDIQRLVSRRRDYPIWLYVFAAIMQVCGRLSWFFYGINRQTIVFESYRKIFIQKKHQKKK